MVLCVKSRMVLPGKNTIPEQIGANKAPYNDALEAADTHWQQKNLDLSEMEQLVSATLANQLAQYHQQATGRSAPI